MFCDGLLTIERVYSRILPQYTDYLREELSNCESVLDLGCANSSPLRYFTVSYSVGVDIHKKYLKESKRLKIHSAYICADIRNTQFRENSFDVVLALDVLEHLSKKEGCRLIENMERWTKRKVIIFTTNGFVWQEEYDDNPFQCHESGWQLSELEEKGFRVYGINGWYVLMGYRGSPRYKPKLFWKVVSDLTQKLTYHYSKYAFQLLCVKEKTICSVDTPEK